MPASVLDNRKTHVVRCPQCNAPPDSVCCTAMGEDYEDWWYVHKARVQALEMVGKQVKARSVFDKRSYLDWGGHLTSKTMPVAVAWAEGYNECLEALAGELGSG